VSEFNYIGLTGDNRLTLLAPQPEQINIKDIAKALGNTCRFGGHTDFFYSVAQHSVRVSQYLPKELALAGLLHDAAEAYIGDIPTPIKSLLWVVDATTGHEEPFSQFEDRILKIIFDVFDIDFTLYSQVKEADTAAVVTEAIQLQSSPPWAVEWSRHIRNIPFWKIKYQSPQEASELFLDEFCRLTGI